MVKHFTSHRPKTAPARKRSNPQGSTKETAPEPKTRAPKTAKEIGGPSGPEPTRYGDWERKGICVDF